MFYNETMIIIIIRFLRSPLLEARAACRRHLNEALNNVMVADAVVLFIQA